MGRGKLKVKPTGRRNFSTHEEIGGGKARVGGESDKNLPRKKTSSWNLPYWKPFLMSLRGRQNQQLVKGGTAACVKNAAKICHSSEIDYDLHMRKVIQEWDASLLERKKNNRNKIPTWIGNTSDDEY